MEFRIDSHDDGGYVWRVLDELGSELAVSRRLASLQACKRSILLLKVEASTAEVVDLSGEPRRPQAPAADAALAPPLSAPALPAAPTPRTRARRAPAGQRRSASSRQRP